MSGVESERTAAEAGEARAATQPDVAAYARRIGYTGALAPNLATLQAVHRLHPLALPFENLTTLLGGSPRLDLASLEQKMIHSGRGGYCFEHNRLLAGMLEALGFEVRGLSARVLWDRSPGTIMPRTHMLLAVELAEGTYISDVGFGGLTLTAPLLLEPGLEQQTPHEVFRVVARDAGFVLEAGIQDEWRPLYWFDDSAHLEIDFEVLNHFVATHPESPFRSELYGARTLPDRRIGLRNARMTVHRLDGTVERGELQTVEALRDALTLDLGITLPERDELDAVLAAVLAVPAAI